MQSHKQMEVIKCPEVIGAAVTTDWLGCSVVVVVLVAPDVEYAVLGALQYGNCSASDCKALQKVVRTTQYIIGAKLPASRTYIPGSVRGRP